MFEWVIKMVTWVNKNKNSFSIFYLITPDISIKKEYTEKSDSFVFFNTSAHQIQNSEFVSLPPIINEGLQRGKYFVEAAASLIKII